MADPSRRPMAAGRSWLDEREAFVPRGVSVTHPIVVTRAEGSTIWDADGNAYIDFVSGIGVHGTGHRHPRVVQGIRNELDRLTHTCFQVATYESYVRLAAKLGPLVGGPTRKTLLVSTGAEAVENAVKIARAATNRPAVVSFQAGFHGRTLLALTLTTASSAYRQNFGPYADAVYHAPFPDEYHGWTTARALDGLGRLLDEISPEAVAAVIIEPEQGEGGFVPAPVEFLRELRAITARHGIVLVADEIQCGFGRTGRMFAYEHAGIDPDLVLIAKSLGGGLPIAAVVGTAAIMDAPAPGGLGGTYAGNPLACAAALAVLDVYDSEGLVARAAEMGRTMRARLERLRDRVPGIGDVRGLGCMLALEFVTDRATKAPDANLAHAIVDDARERGLLLLTCGPHKNVIRLLPPLTIAAQELDAGLDRLEAAIDAATGSNGRGAGRS